MAPRVSFKLQLTACRPNMLHRGAIVLTPHDGLERGGAGTFFPYLQKSWSFYCKNHGPRFNPKLHLPTNLAGVLRELNGLFCRCHALPSPCGVPPHPPPFPCSGIRAMRGVRPRARVALQARVPLRLPLRKRAAAMEGVKVKVRVRRVALASA